MLVPIDISLAQPSPAPDASQPEVRATQFDDWHLRCADITTPDGKVVPQCEVAHVAQVKQDGRDQNIMTLAISRIPAAEGSAELGMTVLVPLNVFLPAGLVLSADGQQVAHMSYRNCNQAGCWAAQKLDQKVIDALKKGKAGESRIQLMNGQTANIGFSLKGLTAAIKALEQTAN